MQGLGVLAAPIVDTSMPVFIDTDGVGKDVIRWLFFPGDSIAPRRKREMRKQLALGIKINGADFPVYSLGGAEINSTALLRTRSVLPRAMFSPLEISAIWMPQDLIPDGAETFRGAFTPEAKWTSTLPGLKIYPGEAIRSVLTTAQNDQGVSQGVVEITDLRGMTWQEVEAMGVQRHFFPEWPKLPVTLREIEDLIRAGVRSKAPLPIEFEHVGEEMLSACDQFRLWASDRIKFEETLCAVGTTKEGWTYRLSDVAEQLMAQLEITPQSRQLQETNRLQAQFSQQLAEAVKGRDIPITDSLITVMNAQRDVFADAFASAIEKVMDKFTAPAAPPETPEPPKPSKPGKN